MLPRAELDRLLERHLGLVSDVELQDRLYVALEDLWEYLQRHPELRDRLQDLGKNGTAAIDVLRTQSPLALNQETNALVQEVVQSGWILALDEVIQRYRFLRERVGIARHVTITSAVALTAQERTALRNRLETSWRRHVYIAERVRPSLIGGLRLEADGWMYDASVRGRLERLQKELL